MRARLVGVKSRPRRRLTHGSMTLLFPSLMSVSAFARAVNSRRGHPCAREFASASLHRRPARAMRAHEALESGGSVTTAAAFARLSRCARRTRWPSLTTCLPAVSDSQARFPCDFASATAHGSSKTYRRPEARLHARILVCRSHGATGFGKQRQRHAVAVQLFAASSQHPQAGQCSLLQCPCIWR